MHVTVRFRKQLPSDVNDRGEVEVVPVDQPVIDPVKCTVKPCTDIHD